MGALRGTTRVVAFVKILVLARILLPAQFGLFGVGMLALSFLEIIFETGVNIFLIQESPEIDEFIDTAWSVSILRGLVIGLLLVVLAPVVSLFFKAPEAKGIIYLIALAPVIRGFVNPSAIKFQKELLFAREFFYRFFMYGIDALVAILLSFKIHSAHCLVYGLIAGAFFELVASHLIAKPKPRVRIELNKLREIVSRGKWVNLAGFFNYIFENFDDAVVVRLTETTSLGVYQMAYKIISLPVTEISDVIQKVTFPVYTKIAGDKIRLKRAYLMSLGLTFFLVLPLGIIFLFFPEPLVMMVLGEKWLGAVPVIRILSFFGVLKALVEATQPLFLSLKKQKYVSLITFFTLIILLAVTIPLVKSYGIVGAGAAALIVAASGIPLAVVFLRKVFWEKNEVYNHSIKGKRYS